MAVVGDYQVQAKAETTERLIAQLVNEGLVNLTLCPGTKSPDVLEGRMTPECDESSRLKTDVVQGNGSLWRLKDFKVPVTLCTEGVDIQEDNPAIARELRNSADMLAKWMEIAAKKPLLDLSSSFIDWEQVLITGHPSHRAGLCAPFPQFSMTDDAQASIRTVSVPGYGFDIKFFLACLITSAPRVLPNWSADVASNITSVLKKLFPPDLWVFGEVAAVTGSQENVSDAHHLTCILQGNMEAKA
ncbi:hypothetical protein BDV39DRAFT_202350 [Aspergillus sergii]|uniref:Aerobactin siderophore biosynthesis IucA/IucC N-terminal domain-containing protein n=1 Tax=Aspergillus sergii TaxID=1034303 RepID=A0A5N6XBK0_9EURO|nr:hypothetical protein BDV39DRAFT_202350 [Aspergillus sergii]